VSISGAADAGPRCAGRRGTMTVETATIGLGVDIGAARQRLVCGRVPAACCEAIRKAMPLPRLDGIAGPSPALLVP
jgi:hypothetical protein